MSKRLDIRHFPLLGSQLIEASAGTGKTFTIALLYTRLILQHGGDAAFTRALEPEQILVVTFTDAATQELKDRIRTRLAEAARCFMTPQQDCDSMLRELREDYTPAQWPGCARRLMLAAQSMDQAAVSTIHGWCYRMLREHAFDSGSLFHQTLITNQQDILADLMRDYWRQQFYVLPVATAAQVLKAFNDPDALLKAVKPLINKTGTVLTFDGNPQPAIDHLADALLPFAGSAQRLHDLQQCARDEWAKGSEQLEALLDSYRQHLNGTPVREAKSDEAFALMKQALREWSAGGDYAEKSLARFAQHNWPLKKNSPTQPEHPALAAIADLAAAQDADRQRTGPDIRATILNHASRWLELALQKRLHEKAELGFDDLLLQLDRALQGPQGSELAAKIRHDFPVAMIDEFQDTDPLQYRIFDRIYNVADNRQDCAVVMIGDPKQAIYSFRNADIHTYLAARSATAGRHYNLDRNYRSTHGVVTAVNHLFEFAERFEKGAFRFRHNDSNPLPFVSVAAQGREQSLVLNGQPAPAMTLWKLMDPDNANGTIPVTRYRPLMARICASAIAGYLGGNGSNRFQIDDDPRCSPHGSSQLLRPRDIAVLVRSRTEADAIRAALQRHKLASVYLSDRESVFASPEARDVLRWLRACAEPADERLLRAALGTRSMALTVDQLAQLNRDELAWEQQTELFRQLHGVWLSHGVLPMLRHLMRSHQLPQRMRALPDGERGLTNLLHLAEYLQKASTQHDGEQALIRHLTEQMEDPGDEEILRLESDDDLIRVVTIHKSKGLEYPLVFLPFIAGSKEIDGNTKQVSIPDTNTPAQRRLEIAGNKIAAEAWQTADAERLSEDMRLLYVAMTRATHGLWLGMAALSKGTSTKSALHNSGIGYLLAGGEPIDADMLDTRLNEWVNSCEHIQLNTVSATQVPPIPAPQFNHATAAATHTKPAIRSDRSPAENWWIASYSALKTGTTQFHEPERATDDQTLEEQQDNTKLPAGNLRTQFNRTAPGLHGFHRGPKPGTFLHNLLEWAAETGFTTACENDQNRLTLISERCKSQGWPEDTDRLDGWLKPFCETRFRLSATHDLKLCELDSFQAELEFLFASNQVSSEAIDQICQHYLLPGEARPALLPAQLNGMVKGFIDLVFSVNGCYYVADWKSNYLGPDDHCYTDEAIRQEVLHKRYDVQYGIYLLALHRLLRSRLPDYSYDQHIGGAVYFFLRGWQAASQGLLIDRPSQVFIDTMDALFSGDSEATSALPPGIGSQENTL